MADDSFFDDQVVELDETGLSEEIESKIVAIVESLVPPADRSTADVKELSFDREALVASVRVAVKVKNSSSAGIPGIGVGPFSFPSEVSLKYNLKTKETSDETLTIKTPSDFPDIKLDVETLKEIMDGNWSKALELIPNGGVVERQIKSNYDDLKREYETKHGPQNVYFASVRFVRWAGLGTVARWVAQAIASGGAASAAIMEEAKREALRELNLVVQFLLSRAQAFGAATAEELATSILSGGKPAWPNGEFPQIAFRFQKVTYSSRLKVAGKQVGGEFAENDHAAFVLIWIGPNGSTQAAEPFDPANFPVKDESPDPPGGTGAGGTQTLPLPDDQGAVNDNGSFQLTLKNNTARALRVKTVRFSDQEPQVFSIDLQAGLTSAAITFLGGSTRGLAGWSLPDGKLTSLQAEPIYQSRQIAISDRAGLPVPEDLGSINTQQQFTVQFRNESQRSVRLKTVRLINVDPVVFPVDLPPGGQSPLGLFFGGSTRMFAVWSLTDGKLLLLEPLPIYQSRCVVYKELVEVLGNGTVVNRPILALLPLE